MTAEQTKSLRLITLYLARVGEQGIPSGELYAFLMAEGVTLDMHQRVLGTLTRNGLVTVTNHFVRLTDRGLAVHSAIHKAVEEPSST